MKTLSHFGRAKLIRALIVWGGWEGHEPQRCAQVVGGLLEGEGFEVRTADSTAAFDDPELGRFDLIVPIVTQATIAPKACQNLLRTVERGTGLAGFHGGMANSIICTSTRATRCLRAPRLGASTARGSRAWSCR